MRLWNESDRKFSSPIPCFFSFTSKIPMSSVERAKIRGQKWLFFALFLTLFLLFKPQYLVFYSLFFLSKPQYVITFLLVQNLILLHYSLHTGWLNHPACMPLFYNCFLFTPPFSVIVTQTLIPCTKTVVRHNVTAIDFQHGKWTIRPLHILICQRLTDVQYRRHLHIHVTRSYKIS